MLKTTPCGILVHPKSAIFGILLQYTPGISTRHIHLYVARKYNKELPEHTILQIEMFLELKVTA